MSNQNERVLLSLSYGALVTSSPKAQLIVSWKRPSKDGGSSRGSAVQISSPHQTVQTSFQQNKNASDVITTLGNSEGQINERQLLQIKLAKWGKSLMTMMMNYFKYLCIKRMLILGPKYYLHKMFQLFKYFYIFLVYEIVT